MTPPNAGADARTLEEAIDAVIGRAYEVVHAQVQALAELRDREGAEPTTLNAAARMALFALDGLLGDTDLPDDNRPGVLAMQALQRALAATPSEPTPAPAEPEPRESISAMYERDYEHEFDGAAERERAAERACSHDDWIPTGPERPSAHDWIEREWTCEACGVFVTERFHPTARPG